MADAFCLRIQNHQQSVALLHGNGYALSQTFLFLLGHYGLVNHHFDVVILVAVQLHAVHYLGDVAVYTHIQIPLAAHLFEEFLVVSLTRTHQRSKDVDALALIIAVNEIQNLLLGILHHLLAGKIGIGRTGTGIEQTQVVVHLGRGSHRRTGILVGGFLFDGNHRTQTGNLVHIRTLHSPQEVSGVCREGFDIPPLSFGKQGIESQRRLAAATQTGYYRQAVARNLHINVF